MDFTRGIINRAKKIVIYGPEGIGKTTLAASFPKAAIIDTESGSEMIDAVRFPLPEKWEDILACVDYAMSHPADIKTLVLDTADAAENFCIDHICEKFGKQSIESFGYGAGYMYLAEEFRRLMARLDRCIENGTNVVITAHSKIQKFERPDESGAYDRWSLKLTKQVSPIIKEWADMLLFCNYKTFLVATENGKLKAHGGSRVIYTSHSPVWDAKNRFGLAGELPMSFDSIRGVVEGGAQDMTGNPASKESELTVFRQRCASEGISEEEVMEACAEKGLKQPGEPIEDYGEALLAKLNAGFSGLSKYIKNKRKTER